MKLLAVVLLALAPIMSSAEVIYGSGNNDLTTITIAESSMAACVQKLNTAMDMINSKGKTIIRITECREIKGAKPLNVYGGVAYHKYL